MKKILLLSVLMISLMVAGCASMSSSDSVTITVKNAEPGAPVKFGIPFPQGALYSPDHVRVLNSSGEEILSQATTVTTWEPVDASVKWLWVFFFADESGEYQVQYGEDVRQTVFAEKPIVFKNNQRTNGYAEIDTGPLRFRVGKDGAGFLDRVEYNQNGDGFDAEHLIASGIPQRGSFLDLMDDAGIDTSRAVVHQHFIERGSGPLHAIVRVEGEYEYGRPDHENSPFTTYIHAYAGKSYLKVLHTITYTGTPDKGEPLNGRQHPDIATQTELLLNEQERSNDEGVTQPKDKIAAAGLGLNYHIEGEKTFRTGMRTGKWWEDGDLSLIETGVNGNSVSVFQTGPDPTRVPPVAESSSDTRIEGFIARISADEVIEEGEKAEGWMDLSDEKWGVTIGLRNMMEEYPGELTADLDKNLMHAYTWTPNEEPMSFERASTRPDGGMVGNFAQGITKTTEMVLHFHDGADDAEKIRRDAQFVLNPPVAHASDNWYGKSGVYGTFASADNSHPALERSMQYKFDWMLFNRDWEPWYGMFDFGDVKNYYFNNTWGQWANNEPAQDFMWWMNFMRTGDADSYKMAQAASRHTMDVDNTHWPRDPQYRGDTNPSLDYLKLADEPEGSPYVGMGRRHANQQHISMLSAHVWLQGWLASYYLDGYHRGLDVARLTGDYYVRRIFQEHGLRGRRLYLSVWSLSELYDATKDPVYLEELNDRVDRMLRLQQEQGGRMNIDRYGYSQNYISHGLTKYLQMFDRPDIERALVEHTQSIYDVPPIDHDMESFLSSIHMLITGYDLTGEDRYLAEACKRSANLLVDEMQQSIGEIGEFTQGEFAEEMERVSNLPTGGEGPSFRGRLPIWSFSNGLRIFGWTHAFSVPYMIDRLENAGSLNGMECVE
ncbi:MAG: hypothetical protein WD139_12125 [Balneolaceae bacterium]